MEYAIGGILLAAFLYFGYKDDFNRYKKEFIFTLIGVGVFITGFLFFNFMDTIQTTVLGILLLGMSILVKRKLLSGKASSKKEE